MYYVLSTCLEYDYYVHFTRVLEKITNSITQPDEIEKIQPNDSRVHFIKSEFILLIDEAFIKWQMKTKALQKYRIYFQEQSIYFNP